MKKNANSKGMKALRLSRETLLNLDKSQLPAVVGGAEEAFSVKFCTETCTTTTGS
jgi:hypothetical protein